MDQISVLIFNMLARRQGVVLPGIGALCVTLDREESPCGVLAATPMYHVMLAPEEENAWPKISDLLASTGAMDVEHAQERYYQWLTEIGSDQGVVIASVGTIRDGVFTPDPVLETTLNPGRSVSPKVIPSAGERVETKKIVLWVLFGVIAGTLIAVGLIFILEYKYRPDVAIENPAFVSQVVLPVASVDSVSMIADRTAASGVSDNRLSPSDSAATKPLPTQSATPKDTVTQTTIAATAVQTTAKSRGRYQVVVGTYSTQANADKFIASARRKSDTLTYDKIAQGRRILVSAFGTERELEASAMRRRLSGLFPDAWVYVFPK